MLKAAIAMLMLSACANANARDLALDPDAGITTARIFQPELRSVFIQSESRVEVRIPMLQDGGFEHRILITPDGADAGWRCEQEAR